MDMADKGKNLPPQGDRTPRGRREGDIVPVPLPSSSSNGQGPSAKRMKRGKEKDERRREVMEEARKSEEEPIVEKPPSAVVREDGFLFEDGTLIRWEDSKVSPLFQRVIIDMEGEEQWTPSKEKYLSQCLASLNWEEAWEELHEVIKSLRRTVKAPEWRSVLRYIAVVVSGVNIKAAALKEELEAARAAAGGIIPLRAENAALRRELKELRERASIRPPSQDVGIQASPPQVEGETPAQESPLGGVLSGILSRLDALEGGMKEVLRRPGTYAQAAGSKKGKGGGRPPVSAAEAAGTVGAVPRPSRPSKDEGRGKRKAPLGAKKGKGLPRPSTMAAVTVTVPPRAGLSYAEVMASAREKISLEEAGVQPPRVRRARTGGLVLEIPGPEGEAGADRLADRLKNVLEPLGVRVARPLKTADLRLRGLDDSVTPEEVAAAIATEGGCDVGRVRVGKILSSPASAGAC